LFKYFQVRGRVRVERLGLGGEARVRVETLGLGLRTRTSLRGTGIIG